MTKLSHLGEFGLIETLKKFQNLSTRVVKGIGDDAAVMELVLVAVLILLGSLAARMPADPDGLGGRLGHDDDGHRDEDA